MVLAVIQRYADWVDIQLIGAPPLVRLLLAMLRGARSQAEITFCHPWLRSPQPVLPLLLEREMFSKQAICNR